ncbi:MAG: CobD/CbiB family protein [Gallionella sp.]|nr:CobD/CbiB family protein [Gallionella sp.]
MSLFALIVALLLEQLSPLSSRKYGCCWLTNYANFFQHHFNAGEYSHGRIAWFLAVLPLLIGVMAVYGWLHHLHPFLSWVFNVLVLYLSLGFRSYAQYFTAIQQALRNSQLKEARELLSKWRGRAMFELNADEIARVTTEQALIAALRHLFGVIVWFFLFSLLGLGGAAGALFYRLALGLRTQKADEFNDEELGEGKYNGYARKMFYLLEWLPIRLTASTFAVVGNFEDTAYCWRSQAASWPDGETGILLASGAGALGVRLGLPVRQDGALLNRPELGVGNNKADVASMQSTIGLVWRSLVLWLVILFMLTLASLLG